MQYEIFSGNGFVYENSVGTDKAPKLFSAQNSFCGMQMKICADKPVRIYADTGDIKTRVYRLLPVCVNRNSDYMDDCDTQQTGTEEMKQYYTNTAPFIVYDPIAPVDADSIECDGAVFIYIRFEISKTTAPGLYSAELFIESGDENKKIPLEITVYNVCVSDKPDFNLINWWGMPPTADGKGLSDYLDNVAALARYAHQNYIWTYSGLFSFNDGKFDFSKAEQYIKKLLNMGFERIEGPDLKGIHKGVVEPAVKCALNTEQGCRLIGQFLKEWYSFLDENGWTEITVQHVFDEPREQDIPLFRRLSELVRRNMPGISIADTMLTDKVLDCVDIAIPTTRFYQLHRDVYDKFRENGGKLWLYTCCWPSVPYLNRFLDTPLLSVRFIQWLCYRKNVNGYLHWGFCCGVKGNDVYKNPSVKFSCLGVDSEQYLPAGDTNIIYPYNGGFIGSMRLEALRAGVEDFDLFSQLGKKAYDIIDSCVTENMTGIYDLNNFEAAYRRLLEMLQK